jgi:hypothetical protein
MMVSRRRMTMRLVPMCGPVVWRTPLHIGLIVLMLVVGIMRMVLWRPDFHVMASVLVVPCSRMRRAFIHWRRHSYSMMTGDVCWIHYLKEIVNKRGVNEKVEVQKE